MSCAARCCTRARRAALRPPAPVLAIRREGLPQRIDSGLLQRRPTLGWKTVQAQVLEHRAPALATCRARWRALHTPTCISTGSTTRLRSEVSGSSCTPLLLLLLLLLLTPPPLPVLPPACCSSTATRQAKRPSFVLLPAAGTATQGGRGCLQGSQEGRCRRAPRQGRAGRGRQHYAAQRWPMQQQRPAARRQTSSQELART